MLSTTPLKCDGLFFETFINTLQVASRGTAFYNLGSFASHLSYLVAEVSARKIETWSDGGFRTASSGSSNFTGSSNGEIGVAT